MVNLNDPISDFLIRMKNAVLAKKVEVRAPYSRFKEDMADLLRRQGYLSDYKKDGKELVVHIALKEGQPVLSQIKIVSTPGLRIYKKAREISAPLGGAGITIVSTSQGLMSHLEAKKKGLGGEIIAEVI